MTYSVSSREFISGVIAGVVLFFGINVWIFVASQCHHCLVTIGFPFPIYQYGFKGLATGGDDYYHYEMLNIGSVVFNLIIIGLSSLGVGVLTEIGFNKMSASRP